MLPILLGLLFVLIGLGKFGAPVWEQNFTRWGYPPWARLLVGIVELAGGLAMLVPRLVSTAAVLLGTVMLGAIGTHLVAGEPGQVVRPAIYLIALVAAGYLRRASTVGGPDTPAGSAP